MNEFLKQQIKILQDEEKIEQESFLKLLEENKGLTPFVVLEIKPWADGNYILLETDSLRLPFQIGEVVTLVEKTNASSTVISDDGKKLVVFTNDCIDQCPLKSKVRVIVGSFNRYTYTIQHKSIRKVANALGNNRLITSIIKGRYIKDCNKKKLEYKNRLDQYQKEAIEHAIQSRDFACIWGPPGTGKTTTLAELIYQLVKLGETVLVSCPSNVAADALYSKALITGVDCVRVGKGAVVKELFLKIAKDELLPFDRFSSFQGSYSRRLKLLKNARAVFTTCSGTCSREVKTFIESIRPFTTLVIDESGNSLESMCYPGFFTGVKRVVFAGDHFQLPPNVKSPVIPKSILERLSISCFKSFAMLKRQYRMNQNIVKWSNQQFYSDQVESDLSVRDSVLNGQFDLFPPIVWYDVQGRERVDNGSKYNIREALQVAAYFRLITSVASVKADSITIITPYKAQFKLLRLIFGSHSVNISSIDASQGSEHDVVILSLVSCNGEGDVGFLGDYRRMNVAITRAKRHVAIFASANTFKLNHPPYEKLLKLVKMGEIWWENNITSIDNKGDPKIHLINYLAKHYNFIPICISSNGYMKASNIKLAGISPSYFTFALQYATPNPLACTIIAILLSNSDDLLRLSSHYSTNSVYYDYKTSECIGTNNAFLKYDCLRVISSLLSSKTELDLTALIISGLKVLFESSINQNSGGVATAPSEGDSKCRVADISDLDFGLIDTDSEDEMLAAYGIGLKGVFGMPVSQGGILNHLGGAAGNFIGKPTNYSEAAKAGEGVNNVNKLGKRDV